MDDVSLPFEPARSARAERALLVIGVVAASVVGIVLNPVTASIGVLLGLVLVAEGLTRHRHASWAKSTVVTTIVVAIALAVASHADGVPQSGPWLIVEIVPFVAFVALLPSALRLAPPSRERAPRS